MREDSTIFTDSFPSISEVALEEIDARLCKEIKSIQRGTSDRFSQRSSNRKDHMQALYLYPAMMVTDIQQELIKLVRKWQSGTQTLFDPFMGSASTLVASLECGMDCYGQDINPMAQLLAQVKLNPHSMSALKEAVTSVVAFAEKSQIDRSVNFNGIDKWFRQDVIAGLSRLREGIIKQESLSIRRFLWVALAETVRLTSNSRISTYKLHIRPASEIESRQINPLIIFKKVAKANIDQVNRYYRRMTAKGFVAHDKFDRQVQTVIYDSKNGVYPFEIQDKFDLLVSSPPYGDNQTTIPYGQHSYLPLQWIVLDDIDVNLTADILQSTHFIDSSSLGGKHGKLTPEEKEAIFKLSPTLLDMIILLGKNHPNKVNKVLNFFLDLHLSLKHISESLKPNSYSIWTLGNRNVGGKEMPNDKIFCEFLTSLGFVLVTEIERKILNKRMPFKNQFASTMKTEKILIYRKRG